MFREGYLFMGLPKERSTAQPERDFYLHSHRAIYHAMHEMFDKADTLAKTHHSVTNTLNLRSIKGNAPQAGNNYKITIIVNPTYLNVLTDNDADSELELD